MSMHRAPARDPHPPAPGRFDETDWDVDETEWLEHEPRPRILWGRLAVFAGVLLLSFLVGRLTAGDDSAAELAAAQAQVGELTQQLEQARAEVQALRSGAAEQTGDGAATPEGAAEDGAAPPAAAGQEAPVQEAPDQEAPDQEASGPDAPVQNGTAEGAAADAGARQGADEAGADTAENQAAGPSETYTVQPGDNLFVVAEKFYGDGQQWRRISEANGLEPGAVLAPGDTLQIPAAE